MAKLAVCQSVNCSQLCSGALLRDIEELCAFGGRVQVEATACLNHCGKGPNVEVTKGKGEPKVVNGVETFKDLKKLFQDSGGDVSGNRRKAAEMKFDARRAKDDGGALAKIEEAMVLLGGQEQASKKEPILASQLLALRARRQKDAEVAVRDAEAATKLAPQWAQGHMALADAYVLLRKYEQGAEVMQIAMDLTKSAFEKKTVRKQLADIQAKVETGGAVKKGKVDVTFKAKVDSVGYHNVKAVDGRGAAGKARDVDENLAQWGEAGVLTKQYSGESLYDRLGGEEQLTVLVYGVYDLMRGDPELGPIFEKFAKTPQTFQRLKVRTVDYLGGEWGGPPYIGPNLFESHVSMAIDNNFYDGMMNMYRQMFKRMNLDQALAQELYKSVDDMRDPIVDPDGKHVKAMEERLAKATAARRERLKKYKAEQEAKAKEAKEAKEGKEGKEAKAKEAPAKKAATPGSGRREKSLPRGGSAGKPKAAPAEEKGTSKSAMSTMETEEPTSPALPKYITCTPVTVSL